MESIIIAIIQVVGTIIVAVFTYFTNHKVQKLADLKVEIKQDMLDQHQETLLKINDLKYIVDQNDISIVRNRIIAFDNLCRLDKNNDSIAMYQYKSYFKDEDKWKYYHTQYDTLNGEIDEAIKNIHKHYENAKFDKF